MAKPQSLQNGTLALELMFGKINHVEWAPPVPGQMHRATQWNTLPMQQGELRQQPVLELVLSPTWWEIQLPKWLRGRT
jgi:hemolysin activation/secretion protein